MPTDTVTTTNDYGRALAWLNGRKTKKLANNTYARLADDGSVLVRYHETDVTTFRPNGEVEYHSGGWLTMTTKDRLNRYGAAGITITQTKGRWYVFGPFAFDNSIPYAEWRARATEHWNSPLTDYHDGMVIRDGQLVTPAVHSGDPDKKVKREIDRYVKGYTDEEIARLLAKAAERGTSGDCWYCAMRVVGTDQPLGEAQGSTGHLLSHLEEDYRMATLAYNAVAEAGYRDPAFILHTYPDGVRRSIRKYLRKRLATNTARGR